METTSRLDQAIIKLYEAYYKGTLNPECCCHCAVGNICDNTDTWKYLTDSHGSLQLSYLGKLNENFGRKIYGYSPKELLQIEVVFLKGCGYSIPFKRGFKKLKDPIKKDLLFNGLCNTIEFLCELDHISNVMDYTNLLEFEKDTQKNDVLTCTLS